MPSAPSLTAVSTSSIATAPPASLPRRSLGVSAVDHATDVALRTMQENWERRFPFRELDHAAIERLIRLALPGADVRAVQPLTAGLRNTNYRVELDGSMPSRSVVLRLYTADPAACQRETALAAL